MFSKTPAEQRSPLLCLKFSGAMKLNMPYIYFFKTFYVQKEFGCNHRDSGDRWLHTALAPFSIRYFWIHTGAKLLEARSAKHVASRSARVNYQCTSIYVAFRTFERQFQGLFAALGTHSCTLVQNQWALHFFAIHTSTVE